MADAGIGELLAATASALREAQSDLVGPTVVAIGEVDLEVKATVRAGPGGLTLEPIGAAEVRAHAIPPDVVSTVRARFVPVPDTPQVGAPPRRDRDAVVAEVAARRDVARLIRVLSGVRFEAVFEPQTRRWLVTVLDDRDRLVREIIVADEQEPRRA